MQWNKLISTLAGVLFAVSPALLWTQENLVVNGDCEEYTSCPNNSSEIDRCLGWQNFSIVNSGDYYNVCSGDARASAPQSNIGYQMPHSGDGYLGSIVVSVVKQTSENIYRHYGYLGNMYEYRESMIGAFIAPLENRIYKFRCYVSYAAIGTSSDGRVATNVFDLMLLDSIYHPMTSTLPYIDTAKLIDLNPNGTIIDDTVNWIPLTICFEAKGGEKYFAVGAMRDSLQITQLEFSGNSGGSNVPYSAYYFFDSFSLVACDTCCGRKPEENVVISGNGTTASPTFQMTLQNGLEADLALYDCLGKLILYHKFAYGEPPFELPDSLARGMYHYVINSTAGFSQAGKVLKL